MLAGMATVEKPDRADMVRELSGELMLAMNLRQNTLERQGEGRFVVPSTIRKIFFDGAQLVIEQFSGAGISIAQHISPESTTMQASKELSTLDTDTLASLTDKAKRIHKAMDELVREETRRQEEEHRRDIEAYRRQMCP